MQTSPSSNCLRSRSGLGALTLPAPMGVAAAPRSTVLSVNRLTAQVRGGTWNVDSPCVMQGFTLTSDFGFMAAARNSDYGDGEAALFASDGGFITLMQSHEGAFDFHAISLGPLLGNTGITRYFGPVLFTGTRADGTAVEAIQTITSTRFQTFHFNAFTHLTSLTFAGSYNGSTGSIPLFGTMVVTPGDAPAPEATPPVSLGLCLNLRRHRHRR